jgi:hypothetical protein
LILFGIPSSPTAFPLARFFKEVSIDDRENLNENISVVGTKFSSNLATLFLESYRKRKEVVQSAVRRKETSVKMRNFHRKCTTAKNKSRGFWGFLKGASPTAFPFARFFKEVSIDVRENLNENISVVGTKFSSNLATFFLTLSLKLSTSCMLFAWLPMLLKYCWHKSGSAMDLDNYRGITLTSNVHKVFSKILEECIMSHLEEKNILGEAQGAFNRVGDKTQPCFSPFS